MGWDEELFEAVIDGDTARVRELLRKGANVNAKYEGICTSLHFAAFEGHADVARLLLEYGADVNARDESGETPLHYAAFRGYADIARLLLEYGADVNARTSMATPRCTMRQMPMSLGCFSITAQTCTLRTRAAGPRCTMRLSGDMPMLLSCSWSVVRIPASGIRMVGLPWMLPGGGGTRRLPGLSRSMCRGGGV